MSATYANSGTDLTSLRLRLLENGYLPIPVTAPDYPAHPDLTSPGKAPFFRGWQKISRATIDETTVAKWTTGIRNHPNTGLLTGELLGLDIDIPIPDLSQQIQQLALAMLGTTPLVRIGKAPKALLCYRADIAMKKMRTPELVLADGTKVQVEAMGDGQQVVGFGIHPDTRASYSWPESDPTDVPLSQLPSVSETPLRAFLAAAEVMLRAAGGLTKKEREFAAAEPQPVHRNGAADKPRTALISSEVTEKNAFFWTVNQQALASIGAWFPVIFPKARQEQGTGAWRISAANLNRGLQEDISVHPVDGGRDFGTEKGCSPIDLVLQWVGAPTAKHAAFWLCERMGVAPVSLGWKAGNAKEQPAQPNPMTDSEASDDASSVIRVVNGLLAEAVDRGEAALIQAQLGIYQRSMFIVRPGVVRVAVASGTKIEAQRILILGESALLEAMTKACAWETWDGRSKEWVRKDCPNKVVKALRDRTGHSRLPVLAGIINAPTLRADGSILATPGYDERTGLLFNPQGTSFPAIPEHPTRDNASDALAVLEGLIQTFPFVGEADRSVALSAILTAVVRLALPTAPMHCFTAPVMGSGKSMLVDICSLIVTGREAGVIAQGKTEEEMEKRLGALLLAGDSVIAIDNVEQPLGGEFLCQMLTQPSVRARILGKSEAPELPSNAFVTATGNNLALIGDVTRRAVLCQLDPKCERPELRPFDQNPRATVRANRGRYLIAALTVLRAFHVAGRPRQTDPLGSFEDWSRWVRDALIWVGVVDPVDTMETTRDADPMLTVLTSVVSQWQCVIGPERVSAKTLIERATSSSTDGWGKPVYRHPDFREALLVVAGAGGAVNSERLGKWLRTNKDRIISDLRIVRAGTTGGTATWQLLPGTRKGG